MAKTDVLSSARLALLEKLGIHSQKFHLRRTEEPLDGSLVAFLRVLQMDQAAIQDQMEKEEEEIKKLCLVQEEQGVDRAVMQYLITRATLLLRSYPTTLEQDQAVLKEATADPTSLLTTQLVLAEKRILVNTVAYCEQRLKPKE